MASNYINFTGGNNDAEDYVSSIMGSQRLFKVDTPTPTTRRKKRNLSLPSVYESTVKKAKATTLSPQNTSPARVIATARRALYNDTPQRSKGDTVESSTKAELGLSVEELI